MYTTAGYVVDIEEKTSNKPNFLPGKGISDLNKVIIIHDYNMEFGILGDSILGVRYIAMRDIQPPLPTLMGISEEYLRGVTGERMVVLDLRKLLADKKIVVHQEACS